MKITIRLILSILLSAVLVVTTFSYFQARNEEERLNEELRLRTTVLAKTFKEAVESFLEQTEQPERIRKFIEKFKGHKRLIGVTVDLRDGQRITIPDQLSTESVFEKEALRAITENTSIDINEKWQNRRVNFHAIPILKNGEIVGALGLLHDRTFIERQIIEFWKTSAITFFILAFLLSAVTLLVVRFSVTGPLDRISEMIQKTVSDGDKPFAKTLEKKGEIEKLLLSVMHMASNLKSARIDLIEQSRLVNAEGTIWTKERLRDYLGAKLEGKPLYVVANREPYIHQKEGNEVKCIMPASGVVTALDPVMRTTGGLWVAHGAGNADPETVDQENKIRVPPWKPSYTLKRVWLDKEEEQGYYYGFSNEGLWPLCHISHVRPIFRTQDWDQYKKANRKFANAVLSELSHVSSPLILIQDYHFALLPKLIKDERPDAKIALFWHIPWPNPEAFGICPWQEEILEGMLGSDIIGFHTQFHCNNFLDTVDQVLESRIDWTTFGVIRGGKTSYVKPFPISVDFSSSSEDFSSEKPEETIKKLKKEFGLEGKLVGLGVDRIDYTKGLLERFRSVGRTLEKYPEHRGKFVFVELGAPSRTLIPSYQNHLQEVESLVKAINDKYRSGNYVPILFLKEHHGHEKIQNFYKLSDLCLVSSLHDGMNLVAKEFVVNRNDENGVLILSRFAGASHEFTSALQVNPYDIEGTADAIHQALTMLPEEKKERMRKMREVVREYNVYRWAADMITELVKAY